MLRRNLSEMEGCVLALIWADGPSTPYALRQVFLKSPSPQWSGSAGSIYPLIERLARRHLIRCVTHATGRREGRLISITLAGQAAMEQWLDPALPDWVTGVPPDPLRTRIRFLAALPAEKRIAFVAAARRAVDEHFRVMLQDYKLSRARGTFEYWMARGAVMSMRARRQWLAELAKSLA